MPRNDLKAVIFDMDGVIADTAEYHFRSWHDVFARHGVNFTRDVFPDTFGRRDDAIVKMIMGDSASPEDVKKISLEKEVYFREIVDGNIKPHPGAAGLIKGLKRDGFKLALASSSVPENIKLILESIGVRQEFDAIVSGMEVEESKPSPQIYLRAAEKLSVPPQKCVVIEDAVAGIEGAKRGGMKAVAVTTSHDHDEFKEASPELIVDSLENLTVSDIEKLLETSSPGTGRRSK